MEQKMFETSMIGWKEVQGMLGVSRRESKEVIDGLNQELKQQKFKVIEGKVPTQYLKKRYCLN